MHLRKIIHLFSMLHLADMQKSSICDVTMAIKKLTIIWGL